jgi:localization factor PodJL
LTLAAPSRVKGIDPRTREIAEDHARRAGLTLREWLGQVIVQDSAHSEPEPLDPEREVETREWSTNRVEAAEHRAMLAIGGMAPSIAAALEKSERAQIAAAARFDGMIDALCNAETHASNAVSDLRHEHGQAHQGPDQVEARAAETLRRLRRLLEDAGQRLSSAANAWSQDQSSDLGIEQIAASLSAEAEAVRADMAARARETADCRFERIERTLEQIAGDQAAEALGHRPARTIERLGGEVARIIEVVDLRLARNEVAAAQERAKLRTEIAQIVEQLNERIADAERRGAVAAPDDQAQGAGEGALYGREEGSSNLAEDLRQSEGRQTALLQDEHERALGLPELRRVVAEAGWFSPCPSRSLDPGLTAPPFARASSASADDDLFFDPEAGLLVAQAADAADCASFALWADEPFGPESSEASSLYATAFEPDDSADLDTIAVGDVFVEAAPRPRDSVGADRVAKVDRGSSAGPGAGSIFAWLGSRRKDATRRGPSKLQTALIVSGGAAVVGMAMAGSAILVSTPAGAFAERVAGVLGQSPVQPLRLRAGESATPFAALALPRKPLT